MAFYITTIILLFILFTKSLFYFWDFFLTVLGFYRVDETVVSLKVVLTLPPRIRYIKIEILDKLGQNDKHFLLI